MRRYNTLHTNNQQKRGSKRINIFLHGGVKQVSSPEVVHFQ